MKYFFTTLIIMVGVPLWTHASVRINEIAWMGVSGPNGQYGEWFELYNDGSETISLDGWTLYKENGAKSIVTLSNSIAPGRYLVIERTTASMPDPVITTNDQSGPFENGFANTGEYLVLKNEESETIQSLNFSTGWPAGDSSTKETMQYSDGEWITAMATPRSVTISTHATAEENSSSTSDQFLTEKTTINKKVSAIATEKEVKKAVLPEEPHISFNFPTVVYQGVASDYFGTVTLLEHETPTKGTFVWNMGDGTTLTTDTLSGIHHTYRYPGIYTVALAYHSAKEYVRPLLQASRVVTVTMPTIKLQKVDMLGLQIKNMTDQVVDLSHWVLRTPTNFSFIPDLTILAPHGVTVIPIDRVGLTTLTSISLETPNATVVATLADTSNIHAIAVMRQSTSSHARGTVLGASVETPNENSSDTTDLLITDTKISTQKNHTKTIIIGAIIVAGLSLLLLLERFIVGRES